MIPTADKILLQSLSEGKIQTLKALGFYDGIIKSIITASKMHSEEALNQASINADYNIAPHWSGDGETFEIDRDSIINAYPLDNIK